MKRRMTLEDSYAKLNEIKGKESALIYRVLNSNSEYMFIVDTKLSAYFANSDNHLMFHAYDKNSNEEITFRNYMMKHIVSFLRFADMDENEKATERKIKRLAIKRLK